MQKSAFLFVSFLFALQLSCSGRAPRAGSETGALPLPPNGPKITGLSVGSYHACAIADGRVRCWGDNNLGQSGKSQNQCKKNPCSTKPVRIQGLESGKNDRKAIGVAAGDTFSCAVLAASAQETPGAAAGDTICWGAIERNRYGAPIKKSALTPLPSLGSRVRAIEAGFGEVAAVLSEPATGPKPETLVLLSLPKMERTEIARGTFTDFGLGHGHGCFLSSGQIKCWGKNDHGQLGNGTTDDSSQPVAVKLPGTATLLAVGSRHNCAVVKKSVWCWGQAFQILEDDYADEKPETCKIEGDREARCNRLPRQIEGLSQEIIDLGAGERTTCAILSEGGVTCWGGDAMTLVEDGKLADVPGLTGGMLKVSAGNNHTCVQYAQGVKCWGFNTFGELGNGTVENSVTPVDVVGW